MFRLMLAIFGFMLSALLDTEGGGNDDPPQDPAAEQPEDYTTFTQKDVDKFTGTARKEGRAAAEKEIAEQFGTTLDEAKQMIANEKKRKDDEKSELDKANEEIKRLKESGEAGSKAANERIKKTELKLALRNADINPERLDMALKLADLDKLEVGDDGEVAGLDDEVKAVSDASPEWFTETSEERPRRTSPEIQRQQSKGVDAKITEAREKGDHREAERLHAQKLAQQKAS